MRKPDDPIASTDSAADPQGGQSFYGRWSRRKRQAREGVLSDVDRPGPVPVAGEPLTGTPPALRADEPRAQDSRAQAPDVPGERALTDSDMPPLESLGENDDYSGFMSPGVSEGLRNLALRKLFRSSQYNVVDGLDDYADDFTHFEPLGDIITSDMRHQLEMQAEREQREAEEEASEVAREEATATLDEESAPGEDDAVAGTAEAAGPGETQAPDHDENALTRAPAGGPETMPDADPEGSSDV